MLHLAAPLGLLALGTLLVPLLIHLVRRPLRVVRVGSLRFLRADKLSVRSLRWHELLLLLLRCALLALLALALANPRWQPTDPKPARLLLLAPNAELTDAARAAWDRLKAEGYTPHPLPGSDLWSHLREADARVPAGSRAVLFASTRSSQFRGPRPALSRLDVTWQPTTEPSTSIAQVTTAATRVQILHAPDRAEDARYVRAALQAAGKVEFVSDHPAWLFQLGDVLLPTGFSGRLVSDAPAAASPTTVARSFETGTSRLALHQRVALPAGAPVLRDSAGEPILTEEKRDTGTHWHFALRFHPDWTDWPLTSAFPAWWREQLGPPATETVPLTVEQATPRHVPAATPAWLPGWGETDLRFLCWLAAALLFAAERLLSHARRAQEVVA